ncbi:MAG: ABC transporter permease [Microscillaceae bacterium]|jgi:putative ABC transport system permease protein|nr:ABC transporter permease [Microscillaceae bacterium]
MLKNYLKIAFRNLWRNKTFSIINISGLAIGLATCMLIGLYIWDELSFDRFNEKHSRIYRINSDIKFGGKEIMLAVAPDPMGHTMTKEYPEVEKAVRLRNNGSFLVKKDEQNIKESKIIYADNEIFEIFSFKMLSGDARTALKAPKTVVISESIARKYFNQIDVVGKTLTLDRTELFKITGVMADMPQNSHFRYDFLLSMTTIEESKQGNWLSHNFNTYLLLKPQADAKKLEAKFAHLLKKYTFPQAFQVLQIKSVEDFEKNGNYVRYSLMPLTKIHLYSDREAELSANSSIQYVYIFSAVALLILLIACTNFMNLSTAKSANRAKEVGVRKVLGSHKAHLIAQFLSESVLLTMIALLIGVALTELFLPYFNQLANKALSLHNGNWLTVLPILCLCALSVGLLAGVYPAFYLSAFNPVNVLKGKLSAGFKTQGLRSVLVVLQFSISIVLIISTIVIYRQLNYIQNKKLGFNKDQVLIVNDAYGLGSHTKTFKDNVLKMTEVKSATFSYFLPVPSARNEMSFFPEGQMQQNKAVSMQHWQTDHDYVKTMGLEIIKGRDFSRSFATDSSGVLINETAAKVFGFTDPVGKKIMKLDDIQRGTTVSYKIIGVVKNFHFESLRQNIGAWSMVLGKSQGAISFRLKTKQLHELLPKIEAEWKKLANGQPFVYQFMDEQFDSVYRTERRVGQIFISFAGLAIFLACLGLFGLAAYATEQRTKEIGIRKVMGASILNIIALVSRDFLRLVIIAFVIATPIAYYFMSQWLQDFAYRIDMGWWIFAIAGFAAFLIALLTIGYQTIRAALKNPVDSLRYE